ncbi:MAG: DNA primase [Gammaproteobacteria bacterium]|jgi:DNA primase
MKIPQSFIDDLLTRIDIVNIIEQYVKLKKAGADYEACCPFHQEKTPSFKVSPAKQIYHCFGCGVGGNAISFLMDYDHQDFPEAIETLAKHAGISIPTQATTEQQPNNTAIMYTVMEKAANFYQAQLERNPLAKNALKYLEKRGLNKETIKQFKIGYAPSGWDNLLRKVNSHPEYQKALLTTGMLIKKSNNSTYDRFRNRIMFPITDRRGRIIAFGARAINDDDTPKYLNSPETPIFHKGHELYGLYEARQVNRNLSRLLLVEGYMDVIALAQHNINYAVATLGTAMTANHAQKLFRACSEIVFCFDGDDAGNKAAWRTLEIILPLLHDNWQAKFVFLPNNEDPDSLIQKIGKTEFEKLIQNAKSLSTFLFSHLSKQINLQQIDGRAHLAKLVMSYIKLMPNNVRKEIIIETLAKQVNLSAEKLRDYLTDNQTTNNYQNTNKQAIFSLVRTAITLLLQNPQLINQIDRELPKLDLPGMALLNELYSLLKEHSKLTTGAILEHWRNTPEYPHLHKLSNHKHLLEGQDLANEFCDTIEKLHSQATEEAINRLITKANTSNLTENEKKQLQNLLKQSKIDN